MADRNLNFDPTVTNVTPTLPTLAPALDAAADVADHVATMSANAKALNAVMQSSMAYRQADAQFRQDAASDPNDPAAVAKLQETRAQINSTIGQQVPAISRMEYMTRMMSVAENGDKLNSLWGIQQQVKNADADTKVAQDTDVKMATMDGHQFAQDGGNMANLGAVLNLDTAKAAIVQHLTPILGAERTEAALTDFSANHVKAFVSAVAETNPAMAKLMLQQDNISSHFTAAQIDDMGSLIKKTEKTQDIIRNIDTAQNDGKLMGILHSDDGTGYLGQINQIQKAAAAGDITSKSADAAIKVLHSQAAVDAQTDAPIMAAIRDDAAGLSMSYRQNILPNGTKDFTQGVSDLQARILTARYNGDLTQPDADRLTKDVNARLTSGIARAVNDPEVATDAVYKKFDNLPPEYKAQATMQLFNESSDQKWTPQQTATRATAIIQQIQDQRRAAALKTVNSLGMSDNAVIKAAGYTMNDVYQTAKESNHTVDEVIAQVAAGLRAKSGAAVRAKASEIKSIKGGSADETDDEETAKPLEIHGEGIDNAAMNAEMTQ